MVYLAFAPYFADRDAITLSVVQEAMHDQRKQEADAHVELRPLFALRFGITFDAPRPAHDLRMRPVYDPRLTT